MVKWNEILERDIAMCRLKHLLILDLYKKMDIRLSGFQVDAFANPDDGIIDVMIVFPNFKDGRVIECKFLAKTLLKQEHPSDKIIEVIMKELEEDTDE